MFQRLQSSKRVSFYAFIFCCFFLTLTSFYAKKWNDWGSQKLISWDISGYYLYLPAFFYSNLGEIPQRQYIIDTYHPCSGDDIYAYRCSTGKYIIKYSSGMAVMYLPGFLAGHLYAKIGNYPVDGFSYPYQFCMAMYSLLISFIGLALMRKVLLGHFADTIVAVALVALCLATNYLNYAGISVMFSHNYLFTVYALIIFFTERWYAKPDYGKTILLGLLCGLAALIRPTEVIAALIPVLWGIKNWETLRGRIALFIKHYEKIILFSICAVAVGSVQLLYWKIYSGHFLYWSYGPEEGFDFLHVPVWDCLFSYRKGWFTYTPLMILSLIGFVSFYRYKPELFPALFLFTYLALHITFSWSTWWYGGSFSMRAVIQYYAVLLFPLCSFFTWAQKRWVTASLTGLFVVFCIWLNLVMTHQANIGGGMESDNMTEKYFWKIFGKVHTNPKDRKFIDTDDEIPAELIRFLKPVSAKVFCSEAIDTACKVMGNKNGFLMTKQIPFIPETRLDISDKKGEWFRATCEAYVQNPGHADIYAWLSDEKFNDIKRKNYHLYRVAEGGKWENFSIDIFVPELDSCKILRFGIYNPGDDLEIYTTNLCVERVRPD